MNAQPPPLSSLMQIRSKLLKVYVTCLGLGSLPKAPGTWTSIVALLFWMSLHRMGLSILLFCSLIIIFFIFGVWAVRIYEANEGSEDASNIVIDEWVGMGISLVLVEENWILGLIALVLFRFFDIVKPLGIRWFQRNYLEGWGVMMDDVVAGIYTAVLIGVLKWLQPLDLFSSNL